MGLNQRNNNSQIIRASELGQFVYCSKAWQLQREGFRPYSQALKKGEIAHHKLGKQMIQFDQEIHVSRKLLRISIFLIGLSIIVILGKMFIWI